MRRTEFTYGQLDRALHALGFSRRFLDGTPPAISYEHDETGAAFTIPPYPGTDFVLEYHLVGARTMADLFGVADRREFDSQLGKAARNPNASTP